MANRSPEQDLIDQFVGHLSHHSDRDLRVLEMINRNCRSKTYADVEFKSCSGLHWVIEAKSNDSNDRHNTVHKIFGELLKETGRTNREDCRHGILIPGDAVQFYSRAFQCVHPEKFLGFGELIPVDTVFTSSRRGIARMSWAALYEAHNPRE